MIKVKLYELEKHRNECTFRPYIWASNVLRDIGIELTVGDSYDYGQRNPSYNQKQITNQWTQGKSNYGSISTPTGKMPVQQVYGQNQNSNQSKSHLLA